MHPTLKRFLDHFPDARRLHERTWTSDTMCGSVDFSVGRFFISVYLSDYQIYGHELSVSVHACTDETELDWSQIGRAALPAEHHEPLSEIVRKIMEAI